MQTEYDSNAPALLSEDELNIQSGGSSWRFANGKIVQGAEIEKDVDGTTVGTGKYPRERKRVYGLLKRIGIFQDPNGKYGPIHRLEADIETSDGMIHLGSNLLDSHNQFKLSVSAITFAWCLLQYQKDEPILLETALGDPVTLPGGKKGGRPTYVNAFRIEGKNALPIYRNKKGDSPQKRTMEEQWAEMEPQLRAHPAWGEREITEESQGGPTHLTELCKEMEAKGWASPTQAPDVWLARLAERNGHPKKARLTDYSDDDWGVVRQAFQSVTDRPAWLPPAHGQGAAKTEQQSMAI